ncbi:head-tail connector protein [Pimelobacter simplex]|uniref:head-tail connector protein n=1 Tax=Nocardioides simplex TaxID=2045 RepID=UPI003AB0418D
MLDIGEVKDYLNITDDVDTKLQPLIDAAEAAIGRRCGALEPTAFTDTVIALNGVVVLPRLPVASVTSVTPTSGGTALDVSGLAVDGTAGIVYGIPTGSYVMTYLAGWDPAPDDLLLGATELVRHLWDTQRGPNKRPGSTMSDGASNTLPGAAFILPFRVSELIAPYVQPGLA